MWWFYLHSSLEGELQGILSQNHSHSLWISQILFWPLLLILSYCPIDITTYAATNRDHLPRDFPLPSTPLKKICVTRLLIHLQPFSFYFFDHIHNSYAHSSMHSNGILCNSPFLFSPFYLTLLSKVLALVMIKNFGLCLSYNRTFI